LQFACAYVCQLRSHFNCNADDDEPVFNVLWHKSKWREGAKQQKIKLFAATEWGKNKKKMIRFHFHHLDLNLKKKQQQQQQSKNERASEWNRI
jgi:hypothetical protein